MVTWIAMIRLPGALDLQVQVRTATQYEARRLIQVLYRDAILLHDPYKLD
jgi:hypothetical protein